MIKCTVFLMAFTALAFPAVAQESAHVHGQGKMLIAQQSNNWHIQFILPAADVLGFEHAPETQQQRDLVSEVTTKFKNHTSMLKLNGNCTLEHIENSLMKHHAEGNHHDEDEHHGEEQHSSHQHGDIEVEYRYSCQSKVTQVSVTLFAWINSLTSIEAQWIVDNGQGLTVLNRDVAVVAWL